MVWYGMRYREGDGEDVVPVMASINSSGPDLWDGLEDDLLLLDAKLLFFSFNSLLGVDLSPKKETLRRVRKELG